MQPLQALIPPNAQDQKRAMTLAQATSSAPVFLILMLGTITPLVDLNSHPGTQRRMRVDYLMR
jgi:hypothetical protein